MVHKDLSFKCMSHKSEFIQAVHSRRAVFCEEPLVRSTAHAYVPKSVNTFELINENDKFLFVWRHK